MLRQHTRNFCVEIASQIDAPTAFSPNFDGVNDVFSLKTLGIINEQLVIFDRWGNLVFQSSVQQVILGWILQGPNCPNGRLFWKLPLNEASKLKRS